MKKIIFFVALILSTFTANAQWSVSPEAGIMAVNRTGWADGKWTSSWKLGVGVEYQFSSLFSLKSGIHYTQRKWDLPFLPWYNEKEELYISTGESKRNFLQVPIMAQLGFDLGKDIRLNVAAGPYVAYSIYHNYWYGSSGSYTNCGYGDAGYGGYSNYGYGYGYTTPYEYPNPFSHLRNFDWGVSFAVGLEVKNLYFNLGYDISLAEESKYNGVGANYHTLSLTVGYKFKL